MTKRTIHNRLDALVNKFETWTRVGGQLDTYISLTTNGISPYQEEALTGDINQALELMDNVQGFPNIQTIAESHLDYQGADIAADWLAIRTPVEAARDRAAAGGGTRWNNYTHTVTGGRGVISGGSRTDATMTTHLQAIKTAIEVFLANIP